LIVSPVLLNADFLEFTEMKKSKTLAELFNEQIGTVGATPAESEKVSEDFLGLLAKDSEGKIIIPASDAEKFEWFMDVVNAAANSGMVKKDIVENLARVKIDGKLIGEKLAAGIFNDAVQGIKTELILADFPSHKLEDEADIKRLVYAYWGMKDTVKVGENELPVSVVLNHNGAFDAYVTYIKMGKAAHKRELTDVEKADMEAAEKVIVEATKYCKGQRNTTAVALRKYFNAEETPTRGRGANKYAAIGSRVDFDSME